MENTNYTFTISVRDISGSLIRILQVFTRRNCRVCSFNIGGGDMSRINIIACNIGRPEHIKSQLEKLVDVNSVDVLKDQ